jgi:hypothetical protein
MKKVVEKKPGKEPKKQEEQSKQRIDAQIANPGKYEITKDDSFKIEFCVKQVGGRWVVTSDADKEKSTEKHWVEFRMWTFDEDVELRKKSTVFDQIKRMHFIDHDMLNRLKIQKLLKRWSFEKDNPNLKLNHFNGVLVDESWEVFKKLHLKIIRHIIEQMNNVLEFNE